MFTTNDIRLMDMIFEKENVTPRKAVDFIKVLDNDGIKEEFSEDIKDLIRELELQEEVNDREILTFNDLLDFDIAQYISMRSDDYCKVYINEEDETLMLFYKEDYQKHYKQ